MDVEREVVLPASPGEVWELLTDASLLKEWFGTEVDGEISTARVAGFTKPDGTERRAIFEVVDAPRRLVLRWLPYQRDKRGRVTEYPPSRVVIDCEEVEGGTRLRVVETRVEAAVSPVPRIGFRPLARV